MEQASLQSGHSAFYKSKKKAQKRAKLEGGIFSPTTHTLRGKGWLVKK